MTGGGRGENVEKLASQSGLLSVPVIPISTGTGQTAHDTIPGNLSWGAANAILRRSAVEDAEAQNKH